MASKDVRNAMPSDEQGTNKMTRAAYRTAHGARPGTKGGSSLPSAYAPSTRKPKEL